MVPQPAPSPSLSVPPAWRTASEGSVAVDRDWWRAFGDPVLDSLVRRALDNNGDLRIASSRLQEFQARVRIADSARLPALNLSLGPTRGRAIGPFGEPVETT